MAKKKNTSKDERPEDNDAAERHQEFEEELGSLGEGSSGGFHEADTTEDHENKEETSLDESLVLTRRDKVTIVLLSAALLSTLFIMGILFTVVNFSNSNSKERIIAPSYDYGKEYSHENDYMNDDWYPRRTEKYGDKDIDRGFMPSHKGHGYYNDWEWNELDRDGVNHYHYHYYDQGYGPYGEMGEAVPPAPGEGEPMHGDYDDYEDDSHGDHHDDHHGDKLPYETIPEYKETPDKPMK